MGKDEVILKDNETHFTSADEYWLGQLDKHDQGVVRYYAKQGEGKSLIRIIKKLCLAKADK
jgi:hypothetical protein